MKNQINLLESYGENKARLLEEFEREFVTEFLKVNQGNISAAARHARMDRKRLSDLIKKHGLRNVGR